MRAYALCLQAFLLVLFVSCSKSSKIKPPNLSDQGGEEEEGKSKEYNEISDQELLDRLKASFEAEKKEAILLKAINTELCIRLSEHRSQCVPAARLIPDVTDRILGCGDLAYQDNTNIDHIWEVSLGGVSGEYRLEADNLYKSVGGLSSGSAEITWKTDKAEKVLSPRLMDIADFRLASVNSDPVPSPGSITFSLKIGETTVLNADDLVRESDDSTYFTINPTSIRAMRDSEECHIDQFVIDNIVDDVKSSLQDDDFIQSDDQNSDEQTSSDEDSDI